MKNKRQPMTVELFKSIIDKAKDYGKFKQIMPFLNGEPLLDTTLVEKIAYINQQLPDVPVVFYSNGSLLTAAKAEEFKSVKVAGINFSINAISDSGRLSVMGLLLGPTVESILNLQKACPSIQIGVSAIMDSAYLTPAELQEFKNFWVEKKITPNFFFNGNWAGKTRKTCNIEGGCARPDTCVTILSDGSIALCCYDVDGEVTFGNIKDVVFETLMQNVKLEQYRLYNEIGRRKDLPLCKSCTTG
jgi:hypothetical protein